MLWNKPEFSLFIDLGTNGELVFGNSDFMMSCACSAGPAFEGGDISCGMRATDGAIEACTIDKETMEPSFTVVGDPGQKPIGLCGSGIIDVISELFSAGIINPKGKFVREGERIHRDKYGMGSYVLAFLFGMEAYSVCEPLCSAGKSDSTDKTEETGSAGSGDTTDNSSDRTE